MREDFNKSNNFFTINRLKFNPNKKVYKITGIQTKSYKVKSIPPAKLQQGINLVSDYQPSSLYMFF